MSNKKWLLDNSHLYNENEQVIAVIPSDTSIEDKRIMEGAPEAFAVLRKFVDDVNNGKLKPRSASKEFELVLHKYTQY